MRSFLLSACIAIILASTTFAQSPLEQAVELNLKGIQEYEKKNFDVAAGLFEQAIILKPDFAKAYYNAGSAYFHLKRLDLAARFLEKATKYDPRSGYFDQLGVVYLESGDLTSATKAFQKAVQLEPQNSKALYDLGCSNMRQGEFREAVRNLEEAKRFKPDDAEIRFNLAIALRQVKRTTEAIVEMEKAVSLRPDDGEIRLIYGNLLLQANDRAGSLAQYALLKTSDPGRAQRLFEEIYKARVVRVSNR